MAKIVRMTAEEIKKTYGKDHDKIMAMAKAAPESGIEDIEELKDFVPSGVVLRGFAAFKEYINKNGRPKSENPKVGISIRIPVSYADKLRATGPGWQTRISDYLVNGIINGDFGAKPMAEAVSDVTPEYNGKKI